MKIKFTYLPFFIGLALGLGIFIGSTLNFSESTSTLFGVNSNKKKLNRLIDYIDHEYVDKVNTDSIVDITVSSILKNLDPHSVYIPKEDIKAVNQRMKGDFIGIGINFFTYNDTVTVIRTIKNGPGDKSGLKSGDRILKANNVSLVKSGISNEEVVNKLQGPINSKVNLEVYRKSNNSTFDVEVTRDVVPIRSVEAAYMLNDSLGYIKLNRFAESSYNEFKNSLNMLSQRGAKALVFDLRDNPGGFLNVAKDIVDEFLKDGKLIYFTRDRSGNVEEAIATSKGDFENMKLYVLINENSASASELIAGALQDNDVGVIVGRRSFGKGLVQREMQLGDGSVVRLTVSRYYTPTGRSIQRPYKNGQADYFDDYFERLKNGELLNPDNIEVDDSLVYTTPKGKTVYGGGGIIPDVFVPLDSILENQHVQYLVQSGIVNFFVFQYLESEGNRLSFNSFTREEFINNYTVPNQLVIKFQAYLNKNQNPDDFSLKGMYPAIKLQLKAALAEQLFDTEAFVEILNENDTAISTVKELRKEN